MNDATKIQKKMTFANVGQKFLQKGEKKVRNLMETGEIGLDRCAMLEIPENLGRRLGVAVSE